jgi:hypothetical protein
MKTLITVIAALALAAAAHAAPWLVCDPQAGVDYYELTGPAWVPVTVQAQPDGSIRMDVSGAYVGVNALTVRACADQGELWGCSEAVPFEFTRPEKVNIPSGFRIVP